MPHAQVNGISIYYEDHGPEDGRPLLVSPVVGDPVSLQLKSGRGAVNVLIRALAAAETSARNPHDAERSASAPLSKLFGL